MDLSRIIYISDATGRMTEPALRQLIDHCRHNNEAAGISGLLLNSGGHFMQVLEGNPMRLAALYERISADPRHHGLQQLLNQPVTERMFPDWGMQLANADRALPLDRNRVDRLLLRLRLRNSPEEAQRRPIPASGISPASDGWRGVIQAGGVNLAAAVANLDQISRKPASSSGLACPLTKSRITGSSLC